MAIGAKSKTLDGIALEEHIDSTLLATMQTSKKDSGVKVPAQVKEQIYHNIKNGAYGTNHKGNGSECECFCVCGYCACKC